MLREFHCLNELFTSLNASLTHGNARCKHYKFYIKRTPNRYEKRVRSKYYSVNERDCSVIERDENLISKHGQG